MGSDIDFGLLQEIIMATIAILIYWIKRSVDKEIGEVKTSLTNINNNISTAVMLSNIYNSISNVNTNRVDVHQYQLTERIKPKEKLGKIEDESIEL